MLPWRIQESCLENTELVLLPPQPLPDYSTGPQVGQQKPGGRGREGSGRIDVIMLGKNPHFRCSWQRLYTLRSPPSMSSTWNTQAKSSQLKIFTGTEMATSDRSGLCSQSTRMRHVVWLLPPQRSVLADRQE